MNVIEKEKKAAIRRLMIGFLFFLAVVMIMFFLTMSSANAQTRGRDSRPTQSRNYSRPAPRSARSRVVITRRSSYRPYYRSYGYGYYGGYYDGYGYGYYYRPTGLKFNLDLIPKDERKLVKKGIVWVDGSEVGIVNRFDGAWNSRISVSDGTHQLVVKLPDGRDFETEITVYAGQALHVYLRFQNGGEK